MSSRKVSTSRKRCRTRRSGTKRAGNSTQSRHHFRAFSPRSINVNSGQKGRFRSYVLIPPCLVYNRRMIPRTSGKMVYRCSLSWVKIPGITRRIMTIAPCIAIKRTPMAAHFSLPMKPQGLKVRTSSGHRHTNCGVVLLRSALLAWRETEGSPG